MQDQEIRDCLQKYLFYHIIPLTKTIATPGWEGSVPMVNMILQAVRSLDLKNKRVLDIGCRDGLFCFEAENTGAREVIGIDNDLSPGATEFLIPFFESKVKMHQMNVLDLKPETFGLFDVVLFPGVLYHLRYPFWALKLIRDVLENNGTLVLETGILAGGNRHALLYCPVGTDSPYEPSSCTFFNLKGLIDTMESLGFSVCHVDTMGKTHLRQGEDSLPEPSAPLPTDRAIMVCRRIEKTANPVLEGYWNGTHKLHTADHKSSAALAPAIVESQPHDNLLRQLIATTRLLHTPLGNAGSANAITENQGPQARRGETPESNLKAVNQQLEADNKAKESVIQMLNETCKERLALIQKLDAALSARTTAGARQWLVSARGILRYLNRLGRISLSEKTAPTKETKREHQ
jgi:SAM-dependent methyltransferase